MGVRGPLPKDPKTRQRGNRPEETLKLPTVEEAEEFEVPPMPALPKHGKKNRTWAPAVVEWWTSIWTSPMRAMWIEADVKGTIYDVALLRQFASEAKTARELLSILGAVRRYESLLGLSALDRLRLRWEIPQRQEIEGGAKPTDRSVVVDRSRGDPRDALRANAATRAVAGPPIPRGFGNGGAPDPVE